jgi:hypothetical protein
LAGQALVLVGLGRLLRRLGGSFGLRFSVHHGVLRGKLAVTFKLFVLQRLQTCLLANQRLLQLVALLKLLAPAAQALAQGGALRVRGAKVGVLLVGGLCQP